MADQKKPQPPQTDAVAPTAPELNNPDFQFVLKALLAAYQPILEQQLSLARDPEALQKEAENHPPNCADEFALADTLFRTFLNEDVALRMLPPEGRKQLGPIENWRWCWQHIFCCFVFGWLVCRGPRTFRAWAYYVYQYWLCVRQVLGAPVANPPTEEQSNDFRILIEALAKAYKPYLTDQLAGVEFPAGIPEEVLRGSIDCFEGNIDTCAIFERLLTTEAARALLGQKAFADHSQDPNFWFCRCWCLCAICFGCCLARARTFIEVLWCLVYFFRCLADCFQPIHCELTAPTGCTQEQQGLVTGGVAVEIDGTAAGAFFDHYTLEWRQVEGLSCQDDTTCPLDGSPQPVTGWSCAGISYPGGGASGVAPVVGGTLGWLNTTVLPPASYEIRVCVYSSVVNTPRTCCCIQFDLLKVMVWIERVGVNPVKTGVGFGPFNPDSPIVNTNPGGIVVPLGCCLTVKGSAFVGNCNNRKIKCFDLRWGFGHLPGPGQVGFNPADYVGSLLTCPPGLGPVCYEPPDELDKRAPWNWVMGDKALTTSLVQTTIDFGGTPIKVWKLQDFCFNSAACLPLSVNDPGGCPDPHHRCRSGKYTLLLHVTDTIGMDYYDTQHVWFDNKPMATPPDTYVTFGGISGLPGCTDLHLSAGGVFVPPGAPCNVPWPVDLMGIAYDEYIDYTDLTYPSDNFDFYSLSITRQGGPTLSVPITICTAPGNPFIGTCRRGDPGIRCELIPAVGGCPPPPPPPVKFLEVLTSLDLRVFDAVCAPSVPAPYVIPPGFPLERGKCCGYAFVLYAQDKTWSDGGGPGNCHWAYSSPWAVCICNDLPVVTGA
jgi:hypothetical protein